MERRCSRLNVLMALAFEIYRDGKRVTEFTPVAAIGMGPESVPVQAEINFEGGLLKIRRPDEHALGLSLLWDMGAHGCFVLETTRLASRAKTLHFECGTGPLSIDESRAKAGRLESV